MRDAARGAGLAGTVFVYAFVHAEEVGISPQMELPDWL